MTTQIKFKTPLCNLNLQLEAASATPNSHLGSILGQYGINIISFCKDFNYQTINYKGSIVSLKLCIYSDKTYNLIIKTTPTTNLIYKYLKLNKETSFINKTSIETLNIKILTDIIKLKHKDFPLLTISKIKSIISNTTKSFGILSSTNFIN